MSFLDRLLSVFRSVSTPAPPPFGLLEDQQAMQNRLPLFDWGPEQLRSMLQLYFEGDFSMAEEFYENIRRDGRMFDGLRKRGNAVTRYPQRWKLAKLAPEDVRGAARRLRKSWTRDCMTKQDLAEVARRLCFFGVCIVYRHYRPIGGVMAPVFTPYSMRGVTVDVYRKVYRVPMRDGRPREVPFSGDREFIVVSAGGDRPWIDGACIPLAKLFLLVNQGWDKWAQHNDVQALAIRVLKTPFYSREQLETGEAYKYVKMLRSGDTWLNPQGQGNTPGYELGLLESKHANAYEAFMYLLANVWTVIAIIFLGHNLSQEVKGGSLAATEAAMEATREVSEADASVITSCVKPVFLEWLVANFSLVARSRWPLTAEECAPRWSIDCEPEEDEERRTKIQQQRAGAVKTVVDAAKAANVDMETVGIDWHETMENCGVCLLPMEAGKERQPVKYSEPPPVLAPGAPGQAKPKPKLMSGRRRTLLLSAREAETEGERRLQPS